MFSPDKMPALAGPYFEANPEADELIGSTATGQFFHPSKKSFAELHQRDNGGELVTVSREKTADAPAPKKPAASEPKKPAAAKRAPKTPAAPVAPKVPAEMPAAETPAGA